MKGNEKLIEMLNSLLAEELTAINQYMVHAEMCENWGYEGLHKAVYGRAIQEMKHAEKLIARILFLESKPIVSELGKIHIGQDVPEQLESDLRLEYAAIKHYNDAIKLCTEVGDNATKDTLEDILQDEDAHVDQIEMLRDQVEQMGLPVFLTTQTEE